MIARSYGVLLLASVLNAWTCSALKNVLFLIADDLRPELSPYSSTGTQFHANIYTPNIEALADKSLLMKQAHVQLPLCGPSRTSFMTGRRPDTTKVHNLSDYWRTVGGPFVTIPEHFKLNGYRTAGMGKIFHQGSASGNDDDAQSWTEPYFHGVANFESSLFSWRSVSDNRLTNKPLIDEQIADNAISVLQTVSTGALNGSAHFFIAVGFKKPHLPLVFPESIMTDHYPEDEITLPSNPYVPTDMPSAAWKTWGELRGYMDVDSLNVDGSENATLPDTNVKELRRAYYSAVTWMDQQLGRVVDEVTNLGLEQNTIISFISDHGFLLGEHGGWCKETLFELATHTPMMLHIPGLTDGGIVTEQLAEFVDIFPTIVEAAGLSPISLCPEDSSAITNCTEGLSLLPLITEPNTPLRTASFSQQPRGNRMGYSIRTHDYRYTEWIEYNTSTFTADWSRIRGLELYDLSVDSEENENVAYDVSYLNTLSILSNALYDGWRNAIE